MEKRKWKIGVAVLIIVVIVVSVFLGWSLTRPDEPQPVTIEPVTIIGRVLQDSRCGGTLGCLDTWDSPVTQCQVTLRYTGAEGTVQIDGQTSSPWSVYVPDGKIVDQVQVDKNGAYSFKLDWPPEGVFTGDINQEVTVVLYQLEIMTTIQGFCGQTVIGSNQIRITEDVEVVPGPTFLLSR